jgi:hypothetical protein
MSGTAAKTAVDQVPEMTLPEDLPNSPSLAEPASNLDVDALAYRLWEERGRPHGDAERDWYKAEHQVRSATGSE